MSYAHSHMSHVCHMLTVTCHMYVTCSQSHVTCMSHAHSHMSHVCHMLTVTCHILSHVAGTPVMNNSTRQLVDQLYEDRLATLLSVQDMVEAVIDALEVGEGQSRGQGGGGGMRRLGEGGAREKVEVGRGAKD